MTTRYRTTGFIFKRDERDESDRVFSVFTSDYGRLEIFAKAIRKITSKLKSGIDIFSFSEVEFIQGKTYKTLTDAVSIDRFNNIKNSPERFKIISKISEVLDGFMNGQEKDGIASDLLYQALERLNNTSLKPKNYNFVYYYFLWNFLSSQGYKPELKKCIICKKKISPYGIYFSSKDGGIVCEMCATPDKNYQKLNSDVTKILRLIIEKDWQTLSRLKVQEFSEKLLQKISDNYYYYFIPK